VVSAERNALLSAMTSLEHSSPAAGGLEQSKEHASLPVFSWQLLYSSSDLAPTVQQVDQVQSACISCLYQPP
jgi:hypothetical protein